MAKKVNDYCNKQCSCCFADIIIGMGIGALLTYPFFGSHPVKWGIGLIIIGVLVHLYPKIIRR